MAERAYPLTIGARVNEEEQSVIDAASRLDRVTRAEFIKSAALQAAQERLVAQTRGKPSANDLG